MQFGKARHLNTCEDFGKIMNDDSRGLGRNYKWRNFSRKISYMKTNTQKDKNRHLRRGKYPGVPQAWPCFPSMAMHPEYGLGAPSMQKFALMHPEYVPGASRIAKIHNHKMEPKLEWHLLMGRLRGKDWKLVGDLTKEFGAAKEYFDEF